MTALRHTKKRQQEAMTQRKAMKTIRAAKVKRRTFEIIWHNTGFQKQFWRRATRCAFSEALFTEAINAYSRATPQRQSNSRDLVNAQSVSRGSRGVKKQARAAPHAARCNPSTENFVGRECTQKKTHLKLRVTQSSLILARLERPL